jgi:hypothetical protein
MVYVKSITYSVVVNGNPVGHIVPSRSLRQGDPLSLYLFLLCAKALSVMCLRAENNGVLISKNGPRINHLFFADDCLLFCKVNLVEWRRLTWILDKYERALSQKLNKEKTYLFFSWNTSEDRKKEITQLSGLQATRQYDKYLGLLTLIVK